MIKIIIPLISLLLFLKEGAYVLAQTTIQLPPSPTGDKFTASGLIGQIISKILPIALTLAGFLAVIFIVISGIQFITSSGDPKGAQSARSRLIYAVIGLVVLILAFAILQIVDRLFLGKSGVVN